MALQYRKPVMFCYILWLILRLDPMSLIIIEFKVKVIMILNEMRCPRIQLTLYKFLKQVRVGIDWSISGSRQRMQTTDDSSASNHSQKYINVSYPAPKKIFAAITDSVIFG